MKIKMEFRFKIILVLVAFSISFLIVSIDNKNIVFGKATEKHFGRGGSDDDPVISQPTLEPVVEEKGEKKEEKIEVIVEEASEVEYKLVKEGTVEPEIYLGRGIETTDSSETEQGNGSDDGVAWSLEYDFSDVPQGDYKVFAEATTAEGTFSSERTSITIDSEEDSTIEQTDSLLSLDSSLSSSDQLKNVKKFEEEIKNDATLTDEQKREKLQEIETIKVLIKNGFAFRQQAEQLFEKDSNGSLTSEEKILFQETKEILKVDSDGDGLPDYEEDRIGSDPFSADSDQDGYLDGDEVVNGYNPLAIASEIGIDKIVFEEPTDRGEESSFYKVSNVEIKKEDINPDKFLGILINGKALPSSFITLYIYSDPIVVTVKTDVDGNWSYTLDKELKDGNHEIYATVTDNTGKITAKSKAFSFIKTAQAISVTGQTDSDLEKTLSPMEQEKVGSIVFVSVISIFSMIIALFSIVLLFRKNKNNKLIK